MDFKMNNETRTIYGYLERPIPTNDGSKISKGFIRCLFEETDDSVTQINSNDLFDERRTCFLLDGYQDVLERNSKRIFRFDAVPNANEDRINQSRYVTFKNNLRDNASDRIFSVVKMPLPAPLELKDVLLPCIPSTKIFFIQDGVTIFGPFSYEIDARTRKELTTDGFQTSSTVTGGLVTAPVNKVLGIKLASIGHIIKFTYQDLIDYLDTQTGASYINDTGTLFFYDANKLATLKTETELYLTAADIQTYLSNIAAKRVIQKQTLTSLRTHLNTTTSAFTPEIKSKMVEFFGSIPQNEDLKDEIVNLIRESPDGRKVLEDYMDEKKNEYITKWDDEASKKHKDLSDRLLNDKKALEEISATISGAKQELNNIRTEIDEKTELLSTDLRDEYIVKAREAAEKELNAEKERILSDLTLLRNEYKALSGLKEVEEKTNQYNNRLETTFQMLNEKKSTIAELDQQLRETDSQLREKIRGIIPTVSALIHAPSHIQSKYEQLPKQVLGGHQLDKADIRSVTSMVINSIAREFSEKYERSYSNEFVASLLVAHQQSVLSVLSGPPGVGKSSFMRILKNILKQDDRFLEVRVARNWSSERDLIGFYNSLSDAYSPSPTGLYKYLKGVAEDSIESSSIHTVLLDEANLSPIEHYGANILSIADTESDYSIQLAHEKLNIPSDLRFVATINFDMTTEPLSPRLLDRAPVIPFDVFYDQEVNYSDSEIEFALPASTFQKLFGKASLLTSYEKTELPESINSVIAAMRNNEPEFGIPIIPSKRKLASILSYQSVLTEVLATSAALPQPLASECASDYSVLYFLLPSIDLHGESGRKRLELILQVLKSHDFVYSTKKAEDILNRGQINLDTYNFLHY